MAGGLFNQADATAYLLNQGGEIGIHPLALLVHALDDLANLRGGGRGAAGQSAYFIGYHGKAAAHLTGARCLNGGIQGQQVGLAGNGLNHAGDLHYLLGLGVEFGQYGVGFIRLRGQLMHHAGGLVECVAAFLAAAAGLFGCAVGALGIPGGGVYFHSNLLGAVGHLTNRQQLRLLALTQLINRVRDLCRSDGVLAGGA